jgi:C-methyltransferase
VTRHPDEAPVNPEVVSEPRPHEIVWKLTNARVLSKCLHAVAEMGVADHLADGSMSTRELAGLCGAHPDALQRVLRLLAEHGVFEPVDDGFRHTPSSVLLRSDHPRSMRAYTRMMGMPGFEQTFARLEHSIRTGAPSLETVHPDGFWSYLQAHPERLRIFGQAMTARAAGVIANLVDAYDFSRFATIADIGGGTGLVLRAVLDAAPSAMGVLFELPHVVAALDFEHGRLTAQAGDFFVDPLPVANLYLLMEIIHDWPDAQCLAILGAVRRAAAPGATVLVIETVLRDANADPRSRMLDVIMLAVTGGRERTASQFSELFRQSGFGEGTMIETGGPLRMIETTAL